MANYIETVEFATAVEGGKWMLFNGSEQSFWVPAEIAIGPTPKLLSELAPFGVQPKAGWERDRLLEKIASATPCEEPAPIDRLGHVGEHFVTSDGTIFSAPDAPHRDFVGGAAAVTRCRGSQTLWMSEVAERQIGQPILRFLTQAAVAAPLLALSPITQPIVIEFILPTGESTLVACAQSAMGAVSPTSPRGAMLLSEAIEQASGEDDLHADLLHVVGNIDLTISSMPMAARGVQIAKFLSSISQRSRPQIYVSFGTRSLSDLAGEGSEIAQLTDARTIKLVVGSDRPFNVFHSCPEKESSITAFAQSLEESFKQHQGHLLHRFLQRLIRERAGDEAKLRAAISGHMGEFKRGAKVDEHDSRVRHPADVFGLIYAAGMVAREWGFLPETWLPLSAVRHCYRGLWVKPAPRASFDDQLLALSEAPETLHLGYKQAAPTPHVIKAARVLVRHHKGYRELIIRVEAIGAIFPHWKSQQSMPEVRARLVREDKRLQVRRRLIPGQPPVLTYCFRLPSEA